MLKRMRLRDRMTLWFMLLMVVTITVFSMVVYNRTNHELEELMEQELRLSLEQIVPHIELNEETFELVYEDEVPLSCMFIIYEEDGYRFASSGSELEAFDSATVQAGEFQRVQGKEFEWLVLDSELLDFYPFNVQVRVATSCKSSADLLKTLRSILLIAIPLVLLVAFIGGRMIVDRSLKPVREIIRSANVIAEGDLSARIPPAPTRDEIGELTDTLNGMLDSVETAFTREKRFTSDASHELRTPVAVMRAYTESLLTEATDDEKPSLETLLTECTRMQTIIGQLLTITRGQEGRYPIHMEEVVLRDICEGVADTLAEPLAERGITLTIDMPETLTLHADQSLLTELVLNLTENAVKYGKEHGTILLKAEGDAQTVRLTVSDDGIGIPEEAIPHLFERFFRVDSARDRSGTGLGLSIVQWIVQAHGGKIDVASHLGSGSSFAVELPAEAEATAMQAKSV